jgi:hypothetical protein
MVARQLRQAKPVGLQKLDPGFFGAIDKLPHARISTSRVDVNLGHRLRGGFDPDAYRMKPEQHR